MGNKDLTQLILLGMTGLSLAQGQPAEALEVDNQPETFYLAGGCGADDKKCNSKYRNNQNYSHTNYSANQNQNATEPKLEGDSARDLQTNPQKNTQNNPTNSQNRAYNNQDVRQNQDKRSEDLKATIEQQKDLRYNSNPGTTNNSNPNFNYNK